MSSPAPPPITSPFVPDTTEVRAWLEKMIKALRFLELISAIVALVTRMSEINLQLTTQLGELRRARPKSETLTRLAGQQVLPLVLGAPAPAKPATGKGAVGPKPKQSRKGKHPGRAALPAHLPRVEVINPVPPERRVCPVCGSMMTTVGHETCEILEYTPASLYVKVRKDERVACPNDDTIVSALTPPQIVERGKLGDTLIVEAVADKYVEHQPTERQSRRFQRSGVDVSPQTLGRSMVTHPRGASHHALEARPSPCWGAVAGQPRGAGSRHRVAVVEWSHEDLEHGHPRLGPRTRAGSRPQRHVRS
jgi:transposase